MKTDEILKNILENGGFDNFNKWNYEEVIEWVRANYNCSRYVAERVAVQIQQLKHF